MGNKGDIEDLNGGIVCLSLVLITAVGAIAGGTLFITIATFVHEAPEPVHVDVGGPSGGQHQKDNGDGYYDEHVWMIANSYYDTANNYLDEETGEIVGFNIDVINEVCLIANKNCQLVLDSFSNAWGGGRGGPALLAGWYDCAQGWFITYPRVRTFLHTEPFAKSEPGMFVVAEGNPSGFDWQNLAGRKLAFFEGWFTDPGCIRRYSDLIEGSSLREEDIIVKPTTEEVIEAVQSGEADAAFVSPDIVGSALQRVGPYLDRCTLGGSSLMCRKDSHLPNWWNPAWRKLISSRRYDEFCDRIETVYNRFDQKSESICLTR